MECQLLYRRAGRSTATSLLLEGTGDPIALQSPRRWGKTTSLLNEIKPAAQGRGPLPVYIDVWQNRDNALSAINYGLSEALDDVVVPDSTVGKRLKTKVVQRAPAGHQTRQDFSGYMALPFAH